MKTCNDCKWFEHIGTIPHVLRHMIGEEPLMDYEEIYHCLAMPIPVKLLESRNECSLYKEKKIDS